MLIEELMRDRNKTLLGNHPDLFRQSSEIMKRFENDLRHNTLKRALGDQCGLGMNPALFQSFQKTTTTK